MSKDTKTAVMKLERIIKIGTYGRAFGFHLIVKGSKEPLFLTYGQMQLFYPKVRKPKNLKLNSKTKNISEGN
jgi:hypothetical protein